MKIQPVVEGHGEIEAVPVLLRRLRDMSGQYQVEIVRPIRRNRSCFRTEDDIRKTISLALRTPDCGAILVIFDSDDDCPRGIAGKIVEWASTTAGKVPCAVVMPTREYEAWFLATIESLRGKRGIRDDAVSHPTPEVPRNAKAQLGDRMRPGLTYSETIDQAPLTSAFDMVRAYSNCRSFRKMVKAFGDLLRSAGVLLTDWPPMDWK